MCLQVKNVTYGTFMGSQSVVRPFLSADSNDDILKFYINQTF